MVTGITTQFAKKAQPAQPLIALQRFAILPGQIDEIPALMLVTATMRLVEKHNFAMMRYLASASTSFPFLSNPVHTIPGSLSCYIIIPE